MSVFGAESKISAPEKTSQTSVKKDSSAQKNDQSITDTVYYESEKIDYNAENKTLVLIGNAYVKYQNMILYADTIHYDMKQQHVHRNRIPLAC